MRTKANFRVNFHTMESLPTAEPEPIGGPQVMKFGGSSVADGDCMRRVVDIVTSAAAEGGLIVVVSAMAGVTDQLVAAAAAARDGQTAPVLGALDTLRVRHEAAAARLLPETAHRDYAIRIAALLTQTAALCRTAAGQRRLAPAEEAIIAGLGERLAAPLLAAAIAAAGPPSEAIAATELILLDREGEPNLAATAECCQARLGPLLRRGVVPVITGFICARHDGAPTTLGRGGSDYSATILAAAMGARASIIWTDVDGVYEADPRLAPGARMIAELSYEAATALAQRGAKVLHPKCLEPVRAAAIPVWIRNTFRPEGAGTRVSADGGLGSAGPRPRIAPPASRGVQWREV